SLSSTPTTLGDSSCENDLEELMRQIDIMVNSKKVEWEQQVVTLQQRLQAQDKELSDARNALDKKKCEVPDPARTAIFLLYDVQRIAMFYSKRIKEFKVLSNEWENQRAFYKNQLKSLCDQRKSLTEKCQLLQEQSQSYQEQLSSRTQLQDEAIANNQAEIRRLRCQLDVSQETIRSDRVIIDNLNSTIKEITLSRNSLKDENQQLLEELNRCQKRCQVQTSYLPGRSVRLSLLPSLVPNKNLSCAAGQLYPSFCTKHIFHRNITSLERLRTDITEPTTKLHQRDIPTATTSDKHFHLEQDLELQEHNNGIQQVRTRCECPPCVVSLQSSTGTSFISAAEKFLNEENKRAKDFEDVLNLHIEEMQRYSENTLAKYRILYQSRHI
uniref:Deuterosome assembly protein 1 n=1 Tax=Leptobrachium leishanense TaxID=445787 RepID=A0A8C5QU87_9ANUR